MSEAVFRRQPEARQAEVTRPLWGVKHPLLESIGAGLVNLGGAAMIFDSASRLHGVGEHTVVLAIAEFLIGNIMIGGLADLWKRRIWDLNHYDSRMTNPRQKRVRNLEQEIAALDIDLLRLRGY